MSIASRIIEIENHISNAYDKIEDLGENLTGVNKNINNIASKLDNIYSNLPKVTGTGTEVTLENTKSGKMVIQPKGNTSQYSTTGKNLLPNIATTQTIYGVTFTVNEDKTILANGQNDGTANSQIYIIFNNFTLPAGSYVLTGCPSSGGNLTYRLAIQDDSWNVLALDIGSGASFTLSQETTLHTSIIIQSNYNANNLLFKPMIRLSSVTDATYEPYTGGASPNPSYPQEIKNVTGDNNVVIRGKNLFNNLNVTAQNNATLEITDTGFNITRKHDTGHGDEFIASYTIENLTKNTVYTFNLDVETENIFDANKIYVYSDNLFGTSLTKSNYVENGNNRKWNITTNNTGKMVIGFYGIVASLNKIFKFTNIQLEENNQATSYEPYITPIEKELKLSGKNLFDKNTSQLNKALAWANGTYFNNNKSVASDFIKVEYGKSYVSNYFMQVILFNENKEYIKSYNSGTDTRQTFTINDLNDCKYIKICFYSSTNNNINFTEIIDTLQLEEGSTATSYEPYYNYTLMKDDCITEDCVIHHKRGKVVFDGSNDENWDSRTGATTYAYQLPNAFDKNNTNGVCSHWNFIQGGAAGSQSNECIASAATAKTLNIFTYNENLNSVENLKTWLSTHNITVEYELAEETTETIPNNIPLYNQIKELYRTIIPGGTIIVETESDSDNAQLIIGASALEG